MKCSYCGNELEKGADFCPECGMILGLNESREEEKNKTEEPEFTVPEYTPNVFKAIDVEEEEPAVPAMELESDSKEEEVPVTENIPEYVSEVPEYTPTDFEDISSQSQEDAAVVAEAEEETAGNSVSADVPDEELVAPEYIPAPDMPDENELDIRVPEEKITYPEYEKYKNSQAENEVINPVEEDYEEIGSEDIYVEPSKKKNGALAIFLVIAVICVIVGGVYAVKNILPATGNTDETTTTEAQQAGAVSENDTTEEDTTEAEEDTTEAEEDTTEAEEDTTVSDEEDTTLSGGVSEDETTTEETTEDEEEESTTAPTTAPSTTVPATTTRPATTRPATTRPSTTDPYGINNVEVKRPAKMSSKASTLYCTAEGVILRSAPSKNSERVLYLSKGADLSAYAKENGYYYVRSNRYGVYGWVSASYASESRPESETTKVHKNTVTPDKKYSKAETKITANGLNLRKGPGTDYDVIVLIPKNYPVKVIGYKNGVSGWVYVTDMTYGHSGWVSAAYLK